MRFAHFLLSKLVTLCFLMIGGVIGGVFIVYAASDSKLLIMAEGLYAALICLWLVIEYISANSRFKRLNAIVNELPEKYLLGEVMPKPQNEVERYYYEIMNTVSRSAIGETERTRREMNDYCEYVEGWIHEMRTPLTACSLILSNDKDISKLKRELKRADNLTESILNYARLRQSGGDMRIQALSANELMNEAVKAQMAILIASNIRVEISGDFIAHSDFDELKFIIGQLLVNCAKYCPNCSVSLTAENGAIRVSDNGIGIPSHEVSRVTEKGFTGTNGHKYGGSTGMGLYIVKSMCERLNIDMSIASKLGEGTEITLSFASLTKE